MIKRDKVRTLIVLAACLFVFVFAAANFFERYRLQDYAYFGNDTHDYQSIAVNLLYGHGFRWGSFEPARIYRFSLSPEEMQREVFQNLYLSFIKLRHYNFFRNPGYSFFLALVYKIGGIHPIHAQVIQILMNAFATAVFPWLGYYYWKKGGFLAGLITSAIVIVRVHPYPVAITTESLILFGLTIWVLLFIFWERHPSKIRTFSLGLYSGVLVFIKGSTSLVPLFFIFYVFWKLRDFKKGWVLWFIFTSAFILVIAPWSYYASVRSGSFVPVSTQFTFDLLNGNNEDCIPDGCWHPEWRDHPGDQKYLYYRIADRGYSNIHKCFIFWWQNRGQLHLLFWRKLTETFGKYYFGWYLIGTVVYYLLLWLKKSCPGYCGKKEEPVPYFPLIYVCAIVPMILILMGHFRYALPYIPFFILPAVYLPILLVKWGFDALRAKQEYNQIR